MCVCVCVCVCVSFFYSYICFFVFLLCFDVGDVLHSRNFFISKKCFGLNISTFSCFQCIFKIQNQWRHYKLFVYYNLSKLFVVGSLNSFHQQIPIKSQKKMQNIHNLKVNFMFTVIPDSKTSSPVSTLLEFILRCACDQTLTSNNHDLKFSRVDF